MNDRTRRLVNGIVPSVVALVAAAFLWLLVHGNSSGRSDYDAERYDAAYDTFRSARDLGVIELWVKPFNTGTAAYRAGRLEDAARLFDRALDDVPSEHACSVRTNLALTYEAIATTAAEEKSRAAAQIALRDARTAVGGTGCSKATEERIQQKIADLDTAPGAPQPDADLTDEEKLDELQKRNEEARKSRGKGTDPETEPPAQIHW